MDHRYSIQPSNNKDLLYSYKDLILNHHENQEDIFREYVIELLKYQGYVYLIDNMKQWSIPKFPVSTWDLQQNGLISHGHFSRILKRLKEQWKLSEFYMTKEELIEYGFQSGIFYV